MASQVVLIHLFQVRILAGLLEIKMSASLDYGYGMLGFPRLKKASKKGLSKEEFFKEFPNCYWCGKKLTMENRSLDHYIPKCHRGRSTFSNYVTACTECNQKKGSLLPREFRVMKNLTNIPLNLHKI